MLKTSKFAATDKVRRETGKRSGLEVEITSSLPGIPGIDFKEERDIEPILYTTKAKKYHPDFQLKNGIYIEAKGWFKAADRTKHLCIKYQHPQLDIRFVFSNSRTKIDKKSKTTYGDWCKKNGFRFADKVVPKEWIEEKGTA